MIHSFVNHESQIKENTVINEYNVDRILLNRSKQETYEITENNNNEILNQLFRKITMTNIFTLSNILSEINSNNTYYIISKK